MSALQGNQCWLVATIRQTSRTTTKAKTIDIYLNNLILIIIPNLHIFRMKETLYNKAVTNTYNLQAHYLLAFRNNCALHRAGEIRWNHFIHRSQHRTAEPGQPDRTPLQHLWNKNTETLLHTNCHAKTTKHT